VGNALKVMDGGPFQARRKILLTGGGALNTFLVQRIMNQTNSELFIPDKALVNYKEAMVFAFLGLLRSLNEINCFASVTGGKHDLSTGVIHIPK
jgi:anhydro-N-acetylmuramic acid kinase